MPQAERRQHPRTKVNLPITFIMGRDRGAGRLNDISLGGIGFTATHRMLRKGMLARVQIQVGTERLEADVVIVRVDKDRTGAYFVKLNDKQKAAVEKLIAKPPA